MSAYPRISIVTPSYNQGRFLAETIESVLRQDYPNVEHIVVDGMSTDETPEILKRYPHLRVIREPDEGQADAINKGFRIATGEIYAFLNSDDLLLPGALKRVAAEIRPQEGRHVIMGRCRFIDENSRYIGIEHPSHFESFERVLAIWKGHFIPQPAVFWTAEVWQRCGPMRESLVLDYDLFCRMAKHYVFHFVDQPLAAYRLHSESKTCRASDAQRLEESIQVSRQYWGPKWRPLYWKLTFSLWAYRLNRQGRASALITRATRDWWSGRRLAASGLAALGAFIAPEVALNMALIPGLRFMQRRMNLPRLLPARRRPHAPQTLAFLDRLEPWSDKWVGPRARFERIAQGGERRLIVQGAVNVAYLSSPMVLTISLDGRRLRPHRLEKSGHFCVVCDLERPLQAGPHTIEVEASTWWVPQRVMRSGDYRPLAWRIFGDESVLLQR